MNISDHYESRRSLDLLEAEDDRRKQLIRLCILRIVAINSNAPPQTSGGNVEELTQKCLNYEMTINKLKQEWNTKDKINEATVDKLKEDIAKLKQKNLPNTGSSVVSGRTFGTKTSLSYATSPYLSRAVGSGSKGFLSPTLNSLNKRTERNPMLVSPIGKRRGKYTNFKSMRDVPANPVVTPSKNSNTRTKADWTLSPNKSPTRMSFVENFDKSDSDDSPLFNDNVKKDGFIDSTSKSVLGGTSRRNNDPVTKVIEENDELPDADGPDANSTSIMVEDNENETVIISGDKSSASTDDEFASANSTLNTSMEKKKRSLKRLNLAGSSIEGQRSLSKGLNVEQDGISSLDYYKDGNFTEGKEDSPKVNRTVSGDFEKKKRRVFKIT